MAINMLVQKLYREEEVGFVGTNNVEREETSATVRKYRQLVRTIKQTRVKQAILSRSLPVMGGRG